MCVRLPVCSFAMTLLAGGCTPFAQALPPGGLGGSFLDEPRGTMPFGPSAATQRQALDAAARTLVEAEVDVLLELRTHSLSLRRELLAAGHELDAQVERGQAFTSPDLRRVRALARRYLELDVLLYSLWTRYRDHLPHGSEPDPYAPMRAATLLSPATRELGGLLSLAAETVRLDNASALVDVLGTHHALAHLLNRGDPALDLPAEGYDRCLGALYDPDHRALLERQLRAVENERERLAAMTDRRVMFLLDALRKSGVARAIVDETDGRRRLVYLWSILTRSTLNAAGPVFDVVIADGLAATADSPARAPVHVE